MSNTARGVKNPLGLKCGPSSAPDGLLKLLDILDPEREPGRMTLICRFGAGKVEQHLPALVRAVKKEERPVVWSCDPMHGNTVTANGFKTRRFDAGAARGEGVLRRDARPRACMPAACIWK